MPRRRTLLTVLVPVLAVALAAAAPAAAAAHRADPGAALHDFVPRWLASLLEAIGLHVDPDGGTVTPSSDGGDTGWHIDPDG